MTKRLKRAARNGLGRLVSKDERDRNYPLAACLPKRRAKLQAKYHWANGYWGDQGIWPHCVAFSWLHLIADGPVTHKAKKHPIIKPLELYRACQAADEFDDSTDGTSIRAAAGVLKDRGIISEYRWVFDLPTAIAAAQVYPLSFGTNWYEGMDDTNAKGFIEVSGPCLGGHAYVIDGVNPKGKFFRVKNSWGRSWGRNGFALLSFADAERLLAEDGELCAYIEVE